MAVKGSKASGSGSGSAVGSKVAGLNPLQFDQGGLADDFNGVIVRARYRPIRYGSMEKYAFGCVLDIEADEDSEWAGKPIEQIYSAGELEHFVPSMDGENPAGGDFDDYSALAKGDADIDDEESMEGIYALQAGKKQQLNNNTNWAHFLTELVNAGYSADELAANPDVRALEGLRAHFRRIDQKKRPGLVEAPAGDGQQSRKRTILVVDEILGRAKAASKTKSSSKASSKKTAAAAASDDDDGDGGGDDMATTLADALIAAARANDGTLTKSKFASVAVKTFSTGAEKTKGAKLATNEAFLEGLAEHGAIWDSEEGTLTLVE